MILLASSVGNADPDRSDGSSSLQFTSTNVQQQQAHKEKIEEEEGGCGCEDEFPPGAGFAFRREGFAVVLLEGGKVVRQRHFFENERVTFKEVLAPGDGTTFPQVGQRAVLRYTEFTSNECLPEVNDETTGGVHAEDMQHSVLGAVQGLDELVMKMSMGEKAMFFASLDLGCVRALQAWLQWWLEATCSEMMDASARIFEVELLHLDGSPPPEENPKSKRLGGVGVGWLF